MSQPQQGTGKTGGLPGRNADPRTAETHDDQIRDSVTEGDVEEVTDTDAATDPSAALDADVDRSAAPDAGPDAGSE